MTLDFDRQLDSGSGCGFGVGRGLAVGCLDAGCWI
jgi:hypothetical protein